jgi:hypothetical protein
VVVKPAGSRGRSISGRGSVGGGENVDTRLKEHQRHICLEHPDKSAVAEHTVD